MADPFVGEIRIFAGNFAPKGWAFCNGQLLPLSQNTALFSLLGTNYGGNGVSNFALPDLQGSVPLGQGQGPGLSQYVLGQSSGTPTVTLLQSEIPGHTHQVNGAIAVGNQESPGNAGNTLWADTPGMGTGNAYDTPGPSDWVSMHPNAMIPAGGSQPHNNMQPYLGLNFIIALQGVFPPRS
ncbi:phage tail protein [Paenibacillus allorhizosphaerae]|uniref:Phage tail collar domain-containing protein n=1 Tax=Paenibacillus allorhizosphaerae TaxID=2849866 RepID=A0ABM8VF71_9BACL|nr:tail fiber protein [Paenibacillus allorhizosphaerae]CAG7633732.1 hypothetical protein PAECIP111802_01977 [Paenibacillus allorhizosphaerae]